MRAYLSLSPFSFLGLFVCLFIGFFLGLSLEGKLRETCMSWGEMQVEVEGEREGSSD